MGLSVNRLNAFRNSIRREGGFFRVVKKRLLKFVFEKEGIVFDPHAFEGQIGIVFSPKDIPETSSIVYTFAKQEPNSFKILGSFNIKEKIFITGADVIRSGKLPSREILLAQLIGMLSAPIKMLLYVLDQKSKMVESK